MNNVQHITRDYKEEGDSSDISSSFSSSTVYKQSLKCRRDKSTQIHWSSSLPCSHLHGRAVAHWQSICLIHRWFRIQSLTFPFIKEARSRCCERSLPKILSVWVDDTDSDGSIEWFSLRQTSCVSSHILASILFTWVPQPSERISGISRSEEGRELPTLYFFMISSTRSNLLCVADNFF